MDFIALDCETATGERSSVCEIGIAIVKDSKIIGTKSWLIKPKDNLYYARNIAIHHITPEQTQSSPSFDEVWKEIAPYIKDNFICAHYAFFDISCLKACFEEYNIPKPHIQYYCTWKMSRLEYDLENYRLDTLCDELGIESPVKHRAGEDARRCAELFLKLTENKSLEDYNTCYNFIDENKESNLNKFVRKHRKFVDNPSNKYIGMKLKDIVPDQTKADPNNEFYGKKVCIKGNNECYWNPAELWKKIADIGGTPQQTPQKNTDYALVTIDTEIPYRDKIKTVNEQGGHIKEIDLNDFFRILLPNIPDNIFKGKIVCIAYSLGIGKIGVHKFLLDNGAIVTYSINKKTQIVIGGVEGEYKVTNLTKAEKYRDEQGLPIEIISEEEFLNLLSEDEIEKYGIYDKWEVDTETVTPANNSVSITIDVSDVIARNIERNAQKLDKNYQNQFVNNSESGNKIKNNMKSSGSGCMVVIVIGFILNLLSMLLF